MDVQVAAYRPQTMTARDPAAVDKPWPRIVIAVLAIAGLLAPAVCFAAAPVAFALSDQDDAILLTAIGLAQLLLAWTLFPAT